MRRPVPSGLASLEGLTDRCTRPLGGCVMLFVGIDWSDRSLEFHARTAEGGVLAEGRGDSDLAGLGQLFAALEVHARPGDIAIAAETAHGAWVQALLDRGYALYPVNP